MSVEGIQKPDLVIANERGNTAEREANISATSSVLDVNEMQPNVDKVIHVTTIYIPPTEPNPSSADVAVMENGAASGSAKDEKSSPNVVVQELTPLPEPAVSDSPGKVEIVPIHPQPTYPAAHSLPDVAVDADHPEKIGEVVPITIQPTYPMAHNISDDVSKDSVDIPAYPAAHLSVPAPVLEESIQIKPDFVRFGTVVTDSSATELEVSFAEHVYPTAHHLPTITAAILDDDGMNEIPLPSVIEPGTSNQFTDYPQQTANGVSNNTLTIEQGRSTSRRRGIVLTVVLIVLLMSSFAVCGVYEFILKTPPA